MEKCNGKSEEENGRFYYFNCLCICNYYLSLHKGVKKVCVCYLKEYYPKSTLKSRADVKKHIESCTNKINQCPSFRFDLVSDKSRIHCEEEGSGRG